MLKKAILIVLLLLVVTGCENIIETPINTVQYFLGKYQRLDKDTMIELDNIINRNKKLTKKEKEEYKRIFERQYQNLSYKIKKEETDYTSSVIIVEIEILDYKNCIDKVKEYYKKNKQKLQEKYKNYESYQISELKKTKSKIKYEIIFNLYKKNRKWKIKKLSNKDFIKIHGQY